VVKTRGAAARNINVAHVREAIAFILKPDESRMKSAQAKKPGNGMNDIVLAHRGFS
jgi:hypothetical protein